ncbi:MAG: hypothetical protein SFU56_19465 [Capsulimonadales bacterium]|nr:hypothetical protein [Capsulimonadales bacterium]
MGPNVSTTQPPTELTEAMIAALIRKAQGILQTRIREAKAQYTQYRVHSCLGGTILMRRQAEGCQPVTVDPVNDTCSCIEHAPPTAERPAGIVVRTRQLLIAAGITRNQALPRKAWPQCKHELTIALLESEYPEIFDRMGRYGRTVSLIEKARAASSPPARGETVSTRTADWAV